MNIGGFLGRVAEGAVAGATVGVAAAATGAAIAQEQATLGYVPPPPVAYGPYPGYIPPAPVIVPYPVFGGPHWGPPHFGGGFHGGHR